MPIAYQAHLMDFLRKNQDKIMNPEAENSLAQTYKPITSKHTAKSDDYFDILFSYQDELYIAKHVRPAPIQQLLPLNFEDVFVLHYRGTVDSFRTSGHLLKGEHINEDFNYELSNPEKLKLVSFGIMTSFPFMDEIAIKIHAHFTKVDRNALCPCGSGKKFKKCCIN